MLSAQRVGVSGGVGLGGWREETEWYQKGGGRGKGKTPRRV